MKLQYGQPIVVAQALPYVGTVDSGPKVFRVVWMEQKDLEHTNTCMG